MEQVLGVRGDGVCNGVRRDKPGVEEGSSPGVEDQMERHTALRFHHELVLGL